MKAFFKWFGIFILAFSVGLALAWFVWPGKARIAAYLMMSETSVPADIQALPPQDSGTVEDLLAEFLHEPAAGSSEGPPAPQEPTGEQVYAEVDVNRCAKFFLARAGGPRRGIEALYVRFGEGEVTVRCHFDGEQLCAGRPDLADRIPAFLQRKGVLTILLTPSKNAAGRVGLKPVAIHLGRLPAMARTLEFIRSNFRKMEYEDEAGFLLPPKYRGVEVGNHQILLRHSE